MRTEETRASEASAGATAGRGGREAQAALAVALAMAGATSAYGAVVRFDNPAGPGHFEWAVPVAAPGGFLDIRLSPEDQDQAVPFTEGVFRHLLGGAGPGSVVPGASSGLQTGIGYPASYGLVGVGAGVLVPTNSPDVGWNSVSSWHYYPAYGLYLEPEGAPTYLGVRFDLGGGFHYGWIGVVRTGALLDVFAWGYETEPGVPIEAGAVPAPGSLALLAFGAAAGAARPRRKDT